MSLNHSSGGIDSSIDWGAPAARHRFVASLVLTLVLLGVAACGSDDDGSQGAQVLRSDVHGGPLRGARYCEILAITIADGRVLVEVYNSISLNDCPPQDWQAIDLDAVRDDLGVTAVNANGLRFFLMDQIVATNSTSGEVRSFGNIEMALSATIEEDVEDLMSAAYHKNSVNRITEFTFLAGNVVYELIDPDGTAFVMQSYAHIVDDTLNEENLQHLGERLELPEGWAYRARTLSQDLLVGSIDGVATVVQDELLNTYQRVD